jgi:hypothetical protein
MHTGGIAMSNVCNRNNDCWGERFIALVMDWKEEELKNLTPYLSVITQAIEKAYQDSAVKYLENAVPRMACLECEEMYHYASIIRDTGISKWSVYRKVYRFSLYRMWAWFGSLVRQIESIHIHHGNILEVYNEEHELVDYGEASSGDDLLLIQKNLGQASPEEILLTEERFRLIQALIYEIEKSDARFALVYAKILRMQLSGIDVGCEHASILGVPEKTVASLKFQAVRFLCDLMAKHDSTLFEKQMRYREKNGRKPRIERSTFKKRLAQYYPSEEELEERKPQTLFIWTRKDGWIEHAGFSKAELAMLPPPLWSESS